MAVQEAGHEFMLAKDGAEALQQIAVRTPDLILLDLLMPQVNGMEFLKKFDVTKHPQTKIIVFTNMDNPILSAELTALGAELMGIVNDTLKKTS
jgi:CheY-like chemotaxis protein